MSERSDQPSSRTPLSSWSALGLGLLLTPCGVALAARGLPRVVVGERLAEGIAFAGATGLAILGLAIAATAEVSLSVALVGAACAATTLLSLVWVHPAPLVALLLVDTALVGLAWALGTTLGRRVQYPSHLLPACVVAASADLVSLLSPEGPSHAIAGSERALSVFAIWFPVPGSQAVAPALGVGDLLFIALIFGVARAHRLPYARSVGLCILGTALAGLAAAALRVAVPALVPIAGAVLLGLPSVRQVRPSDRTATQVALVLASGAAIATLVRSFFIPP